MKSRIITTKNFLAVILVIVCAVALLFVNIMPAQASYGDQDYYTYPSLRHHVINTNVDDQSYYTSWSSWAPCDDSMQYRTDCRYYDNTSNNYWHQVPNVTITQNGSRLYGIDGYGRRILLTSKFAYGLQIQGDKIAMIDRDHYLVVRNGLYGKWIVESTNFDEYWLSRSVLVERVGTHLYYKTGFDDSWILLASNVTPGTVTVNDIRIEYVPLCPDGYSDQYRYPYD